MNFLPLEGLTTPTKEKKLSFLDPQTLKIYDTLLHTEKIKLLVLYMYLCSYAYRKNKVFTALEQDIEKLKIARDLDLTTKLKFLRFLTTALIFYGPEDALTLFNKTIYLLNELKRVLLFNLRQG